MRKALIAGVAVMGTLIGAAQSGLTVNTSASMPRGLWVVRSLTRHVHQGDVVKVCPSGDPQTRRYVPAGFCANGLMPLIKHVAAVPGDRISVSTAGIVVNDKPISQTEAMAHDSRGRPLVPYASGAYEVKADTIWVVSADRPDGYDSRYFGPLDAADIIGEATPMWVR